MWAVRDAGYSLFLLIWPICSIVHPDRVKAINYSRYFCFTILPYRQLQQLTLICLAGLFKSYLFLNISWPEAIQLRSRQPDHHLLLPAPLSYLQSGSTFSWEGSNWDHQVFLSVFLTQCPMQWALPWQQQQGAHSYLTNCTWNVSCGQKGKLEEMPFWQLEAWASGSVTRWTPTWGDEVPAVLPEHLQKSLYRLLHLKRSVLPSHINLGSNKSNPS